MATIVLSSGCEAECQSTSDCPFGESCSEGICLASTGSAITVFSSDVVDERFDLTLEVSFRTTSAELVVERAGADDSDGAAACIPFVPRHVLLPRNDGNETGTQTVVVKDLPALGPNFRLNIRLLAASGNAASSFVFHGPAVDSSFDPGLQLTGPRNSIDALAAPVAAFALEDTGRYQSVQVFVESVADADRPAIDATPVAMPRRSVIGSAGSTSVDLPVLRGPQVFWAEGQRDGVTTRCGVGAYGLPSAHEDPPGTLEVVLVGDHDDKGWSTVSLLQQQPGRDFRCDRNTPSEACAVLIGTETLGARTVDAVRFQVGEGPLQLAALPAVANGASTLTMRVAYNGVHVGLFGPFTVVPEAGESWVAAQVLFSAGGIVDVRALDDVVNGAPW